MTDGIRFLGLNARGFGLEGGHAQMTSAKFLGFFTPCQQFGPVYSTKITQPPLLRQTLAAPSPSKSRSHLCMPPKGNLCSFHPSFLDGGRLIPLLLRPFFRVCSQSRSNGRANDCLNRSLPRTNGAIAVAESVAFGKHRTRGLFFDGHLHRIRL